MSSHSGSIRDILGHSDWLLAQKFGAVLAMVVKSAGYIVFALFRQDAASLEQETSQGPLDNTVRTHNPFSVNTVWGTICRQSTTIQTHAYYTDTQTEISLNQDIVLQIGMCSNIVGDDNIS